MSIVYGSTSRTQSLSLREYDLTSPPCWAPASHSHSNFDPSARDQPPRLACLLPRQYSLFILSRGGVLAYWALPFPKTGGTLAFQGCSAVIQPSADGNRRSREIHIPEYLISSLVVDFVFWKVVRVSDLYFSGGLK